MKKSTVVLMFVTGIHLLLNTSVKAAYDDHIRLRVDGKHIVTSSLANPPSQVFCPVGVVYSTSDGFKPGVMEEFIRFMKSNSLNTVRITFKATNWGRTGGIAAYDFDSTLTMLLEWTAAARENGIYTIFDNHEYLGHRSTTYPNEDVFDFWKTNLKKLAEATKDDPWVIGIEIMNEVYTHVMTREELEQRLREGVHAIREVNTSQIVFLSLHDFDPADFDVLDPPQIVATPHSYPPNLAAAGGNAWDQLELWDQSRTTWNCPILTTEFGAGTGANGLTWERNKTWLKDFMDALDHYRFGWTVWWYRTSYNSNNALSGEGNWFGTTYGPDDPEIWRPMAQIMLEKYPTPTNGVPVAVALDPLPVWFPQYMATGDEIELTLRIVDTTGSMVTNSNAAVNVSVTGPATLSSVPAAFTNGKATVKLAAGATPGNVVVTASSSGIRSCQLDLSTHNIWTDFQVQNQDDSWVDSGTVVDTYSPVCRVNVRHAPKGISLGTARYEYSTDGGATWVYWDSDESDEFDGTSLNTSKWTAVDHNTTGGSVEVADGALTIRTEGEDVWSEWEMKWSTVSTYAKDEFFYVYEERTGDFEIVTKINSQDNTNPAALAGILVRDGMEDTRFNGMCYVAATPDSGFVFAWKDMGLTLNGADKETFKYIDARVFAGNVTYPCYLKLSKTDNPANYEGSETGYNRQYKIFTGSYSTDGVHWTKIMSRYVIESAATQKVGLFACSGVSGTYGEAEFDFYRVSLKAAHTDAAATARYSNGVEQFQTQAIPFTSSAQRQEVRFRINTVPPYTDYMNNPGEELVSPRYSVFDGEHTAVRMAQTGRAVSDIRAVSVRKTVFLNYRIEKPLSMVRFSLYNLNGKKIWTSALQQPKQSGTLAWQGHNNVGVPAGTYIARMEGNLDGTGRVMTAQTVLTHVGR